MYIFVYTGEQRGSHMREFIITAAISGNRYFKEQNPHVPYTVPELIKEGREALDAGAASLHIHARDSEGKPVPGPECYEEIRASIRETHPQAILSFTTSKKGLDLATPVGHLIRAEAIRARPDLAPLLSVTERIIFDASEEGETLYAFVMGMLETIKRHAVIPEIEIQHTDLIDVAARLIEEERIAARPIIQFLFGLSEELPAEIPFMEQAIQNARAVLSPRTISVATIGSEGVVNDEALEWTLETIRADEGRHEARVVGIRVGLEDNYLYSDKKLIPGNADFVRRVVAQAGAHDMRPVDSGRARELYELDQI